jgi:spoIIIJ-associated protein
VAHAEASARTVEAAVTTAAAQLGLRSDQVDVEVLEDPVPSTFGYIGSPARVRVTPRQPAPSLGDTNAAGHRSPHDVPGVAAADQPSDPTRRAAASGQPSEVAEAAGSGQPSVTVGVAGSGQSPDTPEVDAAGRSSDAPGVAAVAQPSSAPGVTIAGQPSDVPGVAAGRQSSDAPRVAVPAEASDPAQAAPAQAAGSGEPSGPGQASGPMQPSGSAQLPAPEQSGHGRAVSPRASDLGQVPARGPTTDPTQVAEGSPAAGPAVAGDATFNPHSTSPTNGSDDPKPPEGSIEPTLSSAEVLDRPAPAPTRDSISTGSGSAEAPGPSGPAGTQAPSPPASSSPAAGVDASEDTGGAAISDDSDPTPAGAGRGIIDQAPTSVQASSLTAAGGGISGSDSEEATAPATAAADPVVENAPPTPSGSERSNATRPRRTYRDEPIAPEMVEADTERAGDFLEGLLDALDVDGDITTWVDEAGGHVDLEGSDLDMLVGSNGETLDALQELTRIAVLRQSKRRVRLLLDINGFRSRQRDQLISIVKATADQVIKSREDHEFQPMTPAERKIVHDAVAAIDGVQTESLGEEPYRRVIIRPT